MIWLLPLILVAVGYGLMWLADWHWPDSAESRLFHTGMWIVLAGILALLLLACFEGGRALRAILQVS